MCAFRHCWNFVNFWQFFCFYNFRLNEKFQILTDSPKRSLSDISESISLFKFWKMFFFYINPYIDENIIFLEFNCNFFFFLFFIKLLTKYSAFVNSDDCIGNISSRSITNYIKLFETLIFGPVKMNFYVKTLDLC